MQLATGTGSRSAVCNSLVFFATQDKVFVILGYKPGDDGMEECYRNVKSEADERSRNKRPHADSEGDSQQSKRQTQSSTSGC